MPGKVCRGSEKLTDFFFVQSHTQPYPFRNGFAGHGSQGHIYTIKSHPVNFLFPTLPVPVRSSVAECTNIKEIAQLIRGHLFIQFIIGPRHHRRYMFTAPCFHTLAGLFHVRMKSVTDSNGATSP